MMVVRLSALHTGRL